MTRLRVESDLTFSVDGAEGRVEADGTDVRVVTTDAARVWDAALGSSTTGGTALHFVADRLAESGVTLTVDGPDGRVATVGAGVSSRLGRLATGTDRVALGGPRAVAPLARARVRAELSRPGGRAVAGAAVVVAVLLLLRRLVSRGGFRLDG